MNQYMVDITLPEYLSEEFVSLIPFQRSQVNRLMGRDSEQLFAFNGSRKKSGPS